MVEEDAEEEWLSRLDRDAGTSNCDGEGLEVAWESDVAP